MKGGRSKADVPKAAGNKLAVKTAAKGGKDLNKLKRPPSSFFIFMEGFRKEFKSKNPNNKMVSVVGKAGGAKWKSMSEDEKGPYVAKAAKLKMEYNKNVEAQNMKQHGYAIVDLEKLEPSNVDDICLSKFLALILQFISQRHRPIRGGVSQLLLDYIRNSPCKRLAYQAGSIPLLTKVVCLTQVVTADELKDDEEFEDIMEDMRGEGGKYGKMVNVVIPRSGPNGELSPGVGKVFLEFVDVDGSSKVR